MPGKLERKMGNAWKENATPGPKNTHPSCFQARIANAQMKDRQPN
jgi:hypothetical protein